MGGEVRIATAAGLVSDVPAGIQLVVWHSTAARPISSGSVCIVADASGSGEPFFSRTAFGAIVSESDLYPKGKFTEIYVQEITAGEVRFHLISS